MNQTIKITTRKLTRVVLTLSLQGAGLLFGITHVWAPFLPDGWGFVALWIPLWPTVGIVATECPGYGKVGQFCDTVSAFAICLGVALISGLVLWVLKDGDLFD